MTTRGQRAVWAAVTVGGVLLAFAPAVAGLRTLSHRDTDRLYAPIRTLVVDALRHGRLPLWNPYEGTGKPLFAEGLHSVLHPVSLLAAAVAPSSIDFLILAYLVAAAFGAFLLARALGASPPASAGAGLAFALSGFSVSMTGNLVFLAGLSTLPWLLAAARHAGAGSAWGMVATALATACAFLSGDAQLALVGLALGLALAADAGGLRGAARTAAAMVPGLLLAAVQIVPTWRLLPNTTRSVDLEGWERTQWALAPGRLLEWIVPGLFRGPPAAVPASASGVSMDPIFSESVYLGAPLLVAAGLGAASRGAARGRRTALLLGAAVFVLLWIALGHHLGARQLLDRIPLWNRFRYTEKLMAPLGLCVAALAALGVDAFGGGSLSTAWRRTLAAVAVVATAALAALLLAREPTLRLATSLLGEPGTFYRIRLAAGLPHLALGLAALLAVDRLRPAPARSAGLALLLALSCGAGAYYGAHLGAPEVRRFTTPLRLETDSPAPRLTQPAEGIFYPDERKNQIDTAALLRTRVLSPTANVALGVDTIDQYGGLLPARLDRLATGLGDAWQRVARRFALTHVAFTTPYNLSARGAVEQATAGGTLLQRDDPLRFELWAVPHRPWAFFASRSLSARSPDKAYKMVRLLDARGDDATVVVEADAVPATAPGKILAIDRRTERVRIEAEADGPALLVVQDAFWPGWRAAIDGEPAEILAADYLVRAVPWPAGRHRLEMVYDPPELRTGLALSALGAALLVPLVLLALRRSRQRRWWLEPRPA